ncbi:MAG: TIM barrel protein, partial [Candidatus Puniceispirillales bacterium]
IIVRQSVDHFRRALVLCEALDIAEFSIHAGFRVSFETSDLGGAKKVRKVLSYEQATQNFEKNFNECATFAAEKQIEIYIENNVFSQRNSELFEGINPFLLTEYSEVENINFYADKNILIDIAHLRVSCTMLGLDFDQQLYDFIKLSDYIHISDNDGLEDQNKPLDKNSRLYHQLKNIKDDLKDKKITLEIYSSTDNIRESHDLLSTLIS